MESRIHSLEFKHQNRLKNTLTDSVSVKYTFRITNCNIKTFHNKFTSFTFYSATVVCSFPLSINRFSYVPSLGLIIIITSSLLRDGDSRTSIIIWKWLPPFLLMYLRREQKPNCDWRSSIAIWHRSGRKRFSCSSKTWKSHFSGN